MLKGKTPTGFSFKIDEEARDDYDLLAAFTKLQNGQTEVLDEALDLLLGKEQKDKLRDHCRSAKTGRVLASKVIKEVDAIIRSMGESDSDAKN